MRQFLSLLLAVVLTLSLIGCGKTEPTPTAPADATAAETPPTVDKPTILCWGDSLTQGAYMPNDSFEYPGILQSLVGDSYTVRNGGYGGDSSFSIMTRQGSETVTTKEPIVFADGVDTVTIGHRERGMGLLLSDGTEMTKLNIQMATLSGSPMDITINPVTIGDAQYELGISFEGYDQKVDGQYYITLKRNSTTGAFTIPAGTPVVFSNNTITKDAHVNIFLMGANDAIKDDPAKIAALVERYKKAIAYTGSDNYIVIIPFSSAAYDAPFKEAFGDKALPFRELAIANGLQAEGITPTATDEKTINEGLVPASLHYRKNPKDIHLNEQGNHFLATCVYEKGKALGYWE